MNKDDKVLAEWKEDEAALDKKSAKKLVWRTRLSITFTVVRTLLAVFLIYVLYMMAVGMYYHFSGKEAAFERFITTVIETRYPEIAVDKSSFPNAEITPLLTQKANMTLYRKVGEWEVVVGEVEAKKYLFGKLNLDFHFDNRYLNETTETTDLPYAIAPDLLGEEVNKIPDASPILDQLSRISDGYVAQLQFSTLDSMTPEALLAVLDEYDINVLEMPIYGGEMTEITEGIGYSSDGHYIFTSTLKLRPPVNYDEKDRVSSLIFSLDGQETLDRARHKLSKDLEWLIAHGGYFDQETDEQRLKYINENEMLVFGAVVTGPIREIERLIEENDFHQFHLGGVEIWNWPSY